MAKRNPLVVGLDVGTYQTSVVVAEVTPAGAEITGIGTAQSNGSVIKGVVANIEETVKVIRKAVEEAELMAGCDVGRVWVSYGGAHVKGVNSHGAVAVKDREVRPSDVDRVLEAAKAIALPMDREVLHVLPQEFVVDDQGDLVQPVGMAGVRLEARVHIVVGATSAGENLVKCCNRAGLKVEHPVIAGPLAAAEAVLTPEERELGVALVDVGAGTTSILVASQGATHHTAVLPVGGNNVTMDLAAALNTPKAEAERMKQRHGCAVTLSASTEPSIEVPGIGGRASHQLSQRQLAEVIEPRCEETLMLVREEIERAGCAHRLTSGIVLTGGGALLAGMDDLAERLFRMPVRLGVPQHLNGLVDVVASPMYSTAVGLVLHGLRQQQPGAQTDHRMLGTAKTAGRKMLEWLREFF